MNEFKINTLAMSFLIISSLLISLSNCRSNNSSSLDAGQKDMSFLKENELGPGRPDRLLYDVTAAIMMPDHLISNAPKDTVVKIEVYPLLIDVQTAIKRVQSFTEIVTYPEKKPVSGHWSDEPGPPILLTFTPSDPLADSEYLIKVTASGQQMAVRDKNPLYSYRLFHVGPLPRIANITFGCSSKVPGQPLNFDLIFPSFSEPIDFSKVKATFEVQEQSAWTTVVATAVENSKGLKMANPIDPTKPLRINIDPDVGAASGLKLDGLYSGKAGSGPFSVTLTLDDLKGIFESASPVWVPDIKI
jgi:hypothetical protein